jgi:hypothetical protein
VSVNARLRDRALDHEVDRRRYSQSILRRIIAVLNRSDARLMAQLAEALMRVDATAFTVERLEALLGAVRATNAAATREAFALLESELREVAEVESLAAGSALRATIPAAVAVHAPVVSVPAEVAYAAAMARPFQGRLLSGWAANVEARRMEAVRNAVRAGFVEGRTTAEVIKTIRGTKALGYADGVLDRPRREVATIVQTALSHTAQMARRESYKANADLIAGVQWVSTLDTRTSPECAIRDGLIYDAETFAPLGHSVPWLEGPGRLHFNCRSVDVPVLKSWKELGIDADELPAGTRASMDGQVPADTTYGDWLLRQSAERQDEILGPARGALLRDGRLKLPDFYDGKGAPLTLAELRAKLG